MIICFCVSFCCLKCSVDLFVLFVSFHVKRHEAFPWFLFGVKILTRLFHGFLSAAVESTCCVLSV